MAELLRLLSMREFLMCDTLCGFHLYSGRELTPKKPPAYMNHTCVCCRIAPLDIRLSDNTSNRLEDRVCSLKEAVAG